MNVFDMIGPVMIGPSSSHTAGAARLGKIARTIFAREPKKAYIGLYGSFAKTGRGHGTDKAIVAGIMGVSPDDASIRNSLELAGERGIEILIENIELDNAHPNTALIILEDDEGRLEMQGSSVGGGSVLVNRLDSMDVELSFETPTLIVRHKDSPGVIAAVTEELYKGSINIGRFSLTRQSRGGLALMSIGLDSSPDRDIIEGIKALPYVEGADLLMSI